jgi:Gram-negative porin
VRNRVAVISAAVTAALLAASDAAHAQAEGLEVRLSGQVNRAIMNVDDGVQNNAFFVDNDISSTRFRLSATAPVQPGLRAGAIFEAEFQSNPSNEVTFATQDIAATLLERHMDVFLEGGWGKGSLGQGDGAANGAMEVDLSGTAVAHWAGVTDIGGGFGFRDGAGGFVPGATIAGTINQQDFESRYDRVRYDTPKFAGFSVAGSWGTKDNGRDVHELALWYTGDFGGIGRVAGALGYSSQAAVPGGFDDKVVGGSVSWLHGSGFNVTLAHSQRDVAASREGKFSYGKLGYKFGKHAVSVDYAQGDDQAAAGDEGEMVGAGYVWAPVAWAELYAALKRHSLDRPGTSPQDIDIFMVGTRVRF